MFNNSPINVIVPLGNFPSVIDSEEENIDEFKVWNELAETKIGYAYDKESFSYTGEHELQPSPLEPGQYLYPPNVKDENPYDIIGPVNENEEYFFNTETNSWDKRVDKFLFPLYDKRNGNLITSPVRENFRMYTEKQPISKFVNWDNEEDNWVINVEQARDFLINNCEQFANELKFEQIEHEGKMFPGLHKVSDYTETYNTLLDGQDGMILTDDGIVELSKESLKSLINKCVELRQDILKTTAYFKGELNNATTLDGLFDVIELKLLEVKKDVYKLQLNNRVLLYVAGKLAENLNKPEEQDTVGESEEPKTNPSQELSNKHSK